MTPEKLRLQYLDWIIDETNNDFGNGELPSGIEIALDLLIKLDPLEFGVVSESIEGLSQSFASNDDGIPLKIMRWLKPYYRLKSI